MSILRRWGWNHFTQNISLKSLVYKVLDILFPLQIALLILQKDVERYERGVHTFCLMGNHFIF